MSDCIDDFITEENPLRVIEAFFELLNMNKLG